MGGSDCGEEGLSRGGVWESSLGNEVAGSWEAEEGRRAESESLSESGMASLRFIGKTKEE